MRQKKQIKKCISGYVCDEFYTVEREINFSQDFVSEIQSLKEEIKKDGFVNISSFEAGKRMKRKKFFVPCENCLQVFQSSEKIKDCLFDSIDRDSFLFIRENKKALKTKPIVLTFSEDCEFHKIPLIRQIWQTNMKRILGIEEKTVLSIAPLITEKDSFKKIKLISNFHEVVNTISHAYLELNDTDFYHKFLNIVLNILNSEIHVCTISRELK